MSATTSPRDAQRDALPFDTRDLGAQIDADDAHGPPEGPGARPGWRPPGTWTFLALIGVLLALVTLVVYLGLRVADEPTTEPERDPTAPAVVTPGPTAPEAATPTPTPPAPTPTPTPEPVPEVRYDVEPRANWDVSGVAEGDALNVRIGPGAHNAVLTTLPRDAAELESTGRIATVDGAPWREIVVPGDGTGWVAARYLTPTPPPPPAPVVVYGSEPRANWDVSGVAEGDTLNVRSGPGTANTVVAQLQRDAAELESTGRIATVDGAPWRELVIPGDGTGWVRASYLVETRPPPPVNYGSEEPALWDVTGIASDAVLDIRSGPGEAHPVVATLPPDATDLQSTGRTATVDAILWREIDLPDAATGWADATYLVAASPPPTPPGTSIQP